MPKSSMPTYVILEKREFEQLFETVERDGQELTALNVKTKNKTKTKSGFRLRKSDCSKKDKKKRRIEIDSDSESDGKSRKLDNEIGSESIAISTIDNSSRSSEPTINSDITPKSDTDPVTESSHSSEPFGYSSLSGSSDSE